jgi:hypothetical protein
MSIKSRINKLETKQPVCGHVITKECIDTAHQLLKKITGVDRPVSYESVGSPLSSGLSEETKRLIDEITGREELIR